MQPWGALVLRVRVLEVQFPIFTTCGLPVRKYKTQEQNEELIPRSLNLATSLRGTMVVNTEL